MSSKWVCISLYFFLFICISNELYLDVANPGITVREALRFSARMRQDPSISLEKKYEYVEKVLSVCSPSSLSNSHYFICF
jgi:hypothetical protein